MLFVEEGRRPAEENQAPRHFVHFRINDKNEPNYITEKRTVLVFSAAFGASSSIVPNVMTFAWQLCTHSGSLPCERRSSHRSHVSPTMGMKLHS